MPLPGRGGYARAEGGREARGGMPPVRTGDAHEGGKPDSSTNRARDVCAAALEGQTVPRRQGSTRGWGSQTSGRRSVRGAALSGGKGGVKAIPETLDPAVAVEYRPPGCGRGRPSASEPCRFAGRDWGGGFAAAGSDYSKGSPACMARESAMPKNWFDSDGIATSAIDSGDQPPLLCTMRIGRECPYRVSSPAR